MLNIRNLAKHTGIKVLLSGALRNFDIVFQDCRHRQLFADAAKDVVVENLSKLKKLEAHSLNIPSSSFTKTELLNA